MTKEEAHKILCRNILPCLIGEWREAISIATKALEAEPHWIPVTERLPEKNGDYLTTLRLLTFYHIEACNFHDGVWDSVPFDEVVAWQPLPEPYKGVTE